MSYRKGSYCGGIRTIEDIKARCIIDDETGCWEWGMSYSRSTTRKVTPIPRCHIVNDDGTRSLTTTAKGAWLLSRRRLKDGHIVYRAHCWNSKCCNPKHLKAGTMIDMGIAIKKAGVLRGDPQRAAVNAGNNARQAIGRDVVIRAEAMFSSGAKVIDVAKSIGVHKDTARKIQRGTHRNSTGKSPAIAMASVFGWRGSVAMNSEMKAA